MASCHHQGKQNSIEATKTLFHETTLKLQIASYPACNTEKLGIGLDARLVTGTGQLLYRQKFMYLLVELNVP